MGQFGAGQTWCLFMDPNVYPNTIDYWGPDGMIFLPNPQARWTPCPYDGMKFASCWSHQTPPSKTRHPGNLYQ